MQFHSYADFCFHSKYYSATWSAIGWIHGFWTVDGGPYRWICNYKEGQSPNPLSHSSHCSRLNCIWNYHRITVLLRNQSRLVLHSKKWWRISQFQSPLTQVFFFFILLIMKFLFKKKCLFDWFLAVLGLRCRSGFSLAAASGAYSLVVVHGHCGGISCCRAQA